MLIDERRFDFIPQNKWKNLTKDEMSNLGSFKSYYRHYKRVDEEIKELTNQIEKKKQENKERVKKMEKLNHKIEHLRNNYRFSWSVSKLTSKNYYNCDISRQLNNKSGTLGSPKLIIDHLKKFYKRDKKQLQELERLLKRWGDVEGWIKFLRIVMTDNSGNSKPYNTIMDMITKDKTLNSITINRKTLFPI